MGKRKPIFKNTDVGSVQKICDTLGISPVEEMAKMLNEEVNLAYCPHCNKPIEFQELKGKIRVPMLTANERVGIHKELLQYLAPKLRATETKGTVQHSLTIKYVNFEAPKEITVETTKEITDGDPDSV